ncbi:ATP-binding protein [Mycobacterium neglectum]|uniref:ATP-binding protein n=1 Tax=Mycobacterium neglectum TaxID=242737 RepID=UPI000BFECA0C|nr:LuxR family transcriptional regulator [Mycobacterium neglectum]
MNDNGPRRLLGRQREQQALADLLTRAREGRSGVVVLRGEAGIGKTSLLEYALARASGFRTIRIAGFESEMEVSYAGLQQLCAPFLGRLDRLPAPQQRALRVALGLEDGDHPDRLMVGLGVLTLLSAASGERPTVCVIDDAQWVDAASLQALAFVARRVLADPIVMLFAACRRRDDRLISDLPELEVAGLGDHDARTLLMKTVPGQLDEQVRENIIAEAGGNPLALTELHRVLSPAELAGGFGLAQAHQLTNRLERAFGQRLTELPTETKTLLLVAAADPTGDRKWLAATARRLGISEDAVEAARAEDFVSLGNRVRFRHPLIRSAVYRGAPLSERRRVHQALADVVDGPAADEHRAWHLAHAANAPDENLAEQLEQSAQQACARSGAAAAAAFLACAVELTPDPVRRARRALLAAEAKMNSGAPEAASKMLMDVQYPSDDPLLSAKIDLLRARTACPSGRGGDMTSLLLDTAKRLHDVDTELARDTYLEALVAAILAGRLAPPDATALTVASAARCAPPAANPRVVDLMLDGLVARILDGYVAGAPLLKLALQAFMCGDAANAIEPRWYDMAGRICLDLFDHDTFEKVAARQLQLFREAGVLAQLPVGLGACAAVDVFGGRLGDAAAHLAEAEATATAIGSPRWRRIEPHLAAYRGEDKICREMVHETIEGGAVEHGQGFSIAAGLFALAVLHNGLGQYAEALSACERGLEHDDPAITGYALAETVEAAARCGNVAAATDALATLVERADASETDTALGLAARSRALTTDGPVAESEYRKAIAHLEKSPAAVYLARSHLVYGEWLRRQGRRVDARAQLRNAFDMFTEMGAEAFAQRAGRELEATGETVRKRTGDPATELTTQESAITKLARDGHTNSEIAAQLFISARTVEWHLSKIFAKLGISSRKELRTAELPAP